MDIPSAWFVEYCPVDCINFHFNKIICIAHYSRYCTGSDNIEVV